MRVRVSTSHARLTGTLLKHMALQRSSANQLLTTARPYQWHLQQTLLSLAKITPYLCHSFQSTQGLRVLFATSILKIEV
jgi:hypothetical protein